MSACAYAVSSVSLCLLSQSGATEAPTSPSPRAGFGGNVPQPKVRLLADMHQHAAAHICVASLAYPDKQFGNLASCMQFECEISKSC